MRMPRINKAIIYPELSYKICGLFFTIHKKLGRYNNEKQYSDAFEFILNENKINYVREKFLSPSFQYYLIRKENLSTFLSAILVPRATARKGSSATWN